jgi:hypothetical protein
MPVSLPYLSSNKNVGELFGKIQSARIPDKFTHDYLKTTVGLKGSNDRPLIPFLRTLGFIDQSGAPTPAYRLLKDGDSAKVAIADAARRAYAPLFSADENAHKLAGDKLRGLIAQVAGTDDVMTGRIAQTFNALSKLANFDAPRSSIKTTPASADGAEDEEGGDEQTKIPPEGAGRKPMQPSFHYNIQVHLPSNGSEEVYLNIFNALRKTFQ